LLSMILQSIIHPMFALWSPMLIRVLTQAPPCF
jgi:hypothetical protein